MTTDAAVRTRTSRSTTPSVARGVVGLGWIEGRRLLRHPAYLAGVALSAVFLFVAVHLSANVETIPYVVWTSLALYPVAAGTFLASFTATLRSRRHGTDELYATGPFGAPIRTGGHLAAVLWGAAGGAVLLAVAAVFHRLWEGTPVHFDTGVDLAVPSLIELAQGPAYTALLGVLAVAVARWLPSLLALPFAVVALLAQFVTGSWGIGGTARWFLPMVTHERVVGWVQVTPDYGYSIVEGHDVASLGWHVAYLVALAGVLAVVALLRHGREPRLLLVGAVGLAATAVTGVLQLP